MQSTIFISHKTEDKVYADRILHFLREQGYPNDHLFLDSDASSGLLVGQKWQESLYDKLQNCVCLIVVGTSKWTTSKWCFAEAFIAKNRNIPIVVLKFEEEADLSFLSAYQAVPNFAATDADLERLVEILTQNQLAPITDESHLSAGWTREAADLSQKDQQELLEQVSQQIKQIGPDLITRRVTVGILSLMLISITSLLTYAFYGDKIANLIDPPEFLKMTTEEFIEAVKDKEKQDDLKDKRVTLVGVPDKDYSASRPRIKLLGSIVSVNINGMVDGDSIPSKLPSEKVELTGNVQSINPLVIGDELVSVIVYMVDVEIPKEK